MSLALKSIYQPKHKISNYSIEWKKSFEYYEEDRHICQFDIICPDNFGYTIGNALRRIIMFSSEGCAVVAFTINGLEHVFQSINGIRETVEEIILNLRKLSFRIIPDDINSIEVTLSKNKKGPVIAGDIDKHDFLEILNENQIICNLDKNFNLEMKLIIGRDIGYITSENHKFTPELQLPYFAIDSLFSNVNCSYDVFSKSEDQKYDLLKIEINTLRSLDTSICMPEKTLLSAVKLMQNCLGFFNPDFQVTTNEKEEFNNEYNSLFDIKIADTELSSRAKNRLLLNGIIKISDLVKRTVHDIRCLGGLGETTIKEINEFLNKYNLSLALQDEEYFDYKNQQG